MYEWQWSVILQYRDVFMQGALVTIGLTLLVILVGTGLGTILGLLRRSQLRVVSTVVRVYVELFRAVPILVLLIWIFYVLPLITNIRLSPFSAALVALSLNLSAYVAETMRAGINAIPKIQYESGIVLGLSPLQVMFQIILPQAFRSMLPNLLGHYITQLKNTSLASVIAVDELLHRSNIVISNSYRPLEVYTAVAVIYLALILPFTICASWMETGLARKVKQI
ncbi:MAG: amino acid ABC transporter permease [bacterium]